MMLDWGILETLASVFASYGQIPYLLLAALTLQEWPQDDYLYVTNGSRFDFIVVGAGSAGATVAGRLSEIPDCRVLLIEAGGDPPLASAAVDLQPQLLGSQYDWNYTAFNDRYASQALNGGVVKLPRGKMLGGSSSINNMIYSRGNPLDYDRWFKAGFEGWGWNTVLKYFLKSEDMQDRTLLFNPKYAPYHNTGGPLKISRGYHNRIHEEKISILQESISEIGIESILDYNGPTQFGISRTYYTYSEPPAIRSSSARAFLVPAGGRKNLYIIKDTFAKRVLIDGQKVAKGVEITVRNKTFNVYADKEVIVSAGAYNTPKILVASGIGPAQDVKHLGIEVISDLPVGVGMQDHISLMIFVSGANDTRTLNLTEDNSFVSLVGFLSLDDKYRGYPDVQYTVNYLDYANRRMTQSHGGFYQNEEANKSLRETALKHEVISVLVTLMHPQSRGVVKVRSVDPSVQPEIYQGLFTSQNDIVTLREGVKRLLNITESTYFKSAGSFVVDLNIAQCKHLEFMTDDYWDCFVLNTGTAGLHPAGTCAMGKVVDNHLRVYGVKNLRVVDASVFPTMTSGNINAPTMMVGERLADYLKEEYYNYVPYVNLKTKTRT